MELQKTKFKIRCEMSGCKNFAEYTVKIARIGIRAHLHICADCMRELYGLMAKEIVPRPIENALSGKSRKKATNNE